MKWTNEKATAPGWYWCRDTRKGRTPFIVLMEKERDGTIAPTSNEIYIYNSAKKLQWAGPIPEPDE